MGELRQRITVAEFYEWIACWKWEREASQRASQPNDDGQRDQQGTKNCTMPEADMCTDPGCSIHG